MPMQLWRIGLPRTKPDERGRPVTTRSGHLDRMSASHPKETVRLKPIAGIGASGDDRQRGSVTTRPTSREKAVNMLLIAALVFAEPTASEFPERTPQLIEECILDAVAKTQVEDTVESHKYVCSGRPAEQFWTFLEKAKIASYEQDAGPDGHWLSRDFPLGGCFKRLRTADGTPTTTGLSCSIWIPRVATQ